MNICYPPATRFEEHQKAGMRVLTEFLAFSLQIENCAGRGGLGQQAQGMPYDVALPLYIPDPSNSTAQQVRGYDSARDVKGLRVMSKGADVDGDG